MMADLQGRWSTMRLDVLLRGGLSDPRAMDATAGRDRRGRLLANWGEVIVENSTESEDAGLKDS